MKKQLFILLNLICIQSGYLFSMEKSQGSNLKKFEPLLSETAPKNGSRQRLLAILAVRALDFESVNIPSFAKATAGQALPKSESE
jgi:hypothetical protein